jgi:hypothetical protein
MAYSLAFLKFRKSLESEIRNYWSGKITTDFSSKWTTQFDLQKRITQIASNDPPFSYLDIKGSEFISQLPTVVEYNRENALVNFVTAFEVYLFEILSRIIYLQPMTLSDSEMKFEAKEIAYGFTTTNFKLWFSEKVTDKTVRNKQHAEILKRIAKNSKCDLGPLKTKIDDWNKWTYVRNSIVHTGRRISSGLKAVWPERFSTKGSKLNILDNELMMVQALAMKIAKHIDLRVCEEVIKFEDCGLLVRELFIRDGIEQPNHLKRILQKNLSYKATRVEIEKILGFQRRTNSLITEIDFDGIIGQIER